MDVVKSPGTDRTERSHRSSADPSVRRLRLVPALDEVGPPTEAPVDDGVVASTLRLVGGLVTLAGDVVVALTTFAGRRLAAGLAGIEPQTRPVRSGDRRDRVGSAGPNEEAECRTSSWRSSWWSSS